MAVVITDLATHIEFAFTGDITTEKFTLPYGDISLHLGTDVVEVSAGSGFNKGKKPVVMELHYTKVTTPSVASNSLLYDAIKTMLTT